jgi:hypothetical protein
MSSGSVTPRRIVPFHRGSAQHTICAIAACHRDHAPDIARLPNHSHGSKRRADAPHCVRSRTHAPVPRVPQAGPMWP